MNLWTPTTWLERDRTAEERRFADEWSAMDRADTCAILALVMIFPWLLMFFLNNPRNIRIEEARHWISVIVACGVFSAGLTILRRFVTGTAATQRMAVLLVTCVIVTFALLNAAWLHYSYLAVERVHRLVAMYPLSDGINGLLPHRGLTEALTESNVVAASGLVMGAITLYLSQMPLGLTLLSGVLFIVANLLALANHPDRGTFLMLGIPLLLGATCAGVSRVLGLRREAFAELEARRLKEREAVLDYEKEMEVARLIHEANVPPPLQRFKNDVSVRSFRTSHETVGGDWLAVHETGGGQLVMMVAAVAGKGLKAALVAHAIQSIWALASASETFDARKFLGQVNAALASMGQQKMHAATMGIAVIEAGTVTYWSAAHPPLQMVTLLAGKEPVSVTLAAKGETVGLGEDLGLVPASAILPREGRTSLLMGTDGVFGAGEVRESSVVALLDRMHKHGVEAVRTATKDDKTLIWAELSA